MSAAFREHCCGAATLAGMCQPAVAAAANVRTSDKQIVIPDK
jgi:hypothetical protein